MLTSINRSLSLLLSVALVSMVTALNPAGAQSRKAPAGQINAPDLMKNGGPDCSSATVIEGSSIPIVYQDHGDTCGAPSVVSNYQSTACQAPLYPGPEVIYQIALTNNHHQFYSLAPTSADLGFFLVSDCAAPTSCVDFHDAIGGGEDSYLPVIQSPTYPTGTYYFYVDSYYASGPLSCGEYRLDIGGIAVELMRFTIE